MGALIFEGPRILLVERAREPLKGWWPLPGGVLEPGELLRDAVIREVHEETGLRIEPLEVVEIFERILRDSDGRAEYHYVLIDYVCRAVGGTLTASDDAANARWFTLDELPDLHLTEGTLAVILKVAPGYISDNGRSAANLRSDT